MPGFPAARRGPSMAALRISAVSLCAGIRIRARFALFPEDPNIGVYAPFFFPEQEWIRCQPEFSPSLLTRSDPVAMPTILPPLTA
jgi:hypothetical protein